MKFKEEERVIYCKRWSYNKKLDYKNCFFNQEYNEDSDKRSHWKGYLIHRENKPAVEWSDGSKEWYLNGLRHREDGPAQEYCGEYSVYRWYLNGKEYSKKEYLKIINLMNKSRVLNEI